MSARYLVRRQRQQRLQAVDALSLNQGAGVPNQVQLLQPLDQHVLPLNRHRTNRLHVREESQELLELNVVVPVRVHRL